MSAHSFWVLVKSKGFYDVQHLFAHNGTISGDGSCADGQFKVT